MNRLDYKHGHKGFSLLEVLITILILSVGLLGMASLQLNAMKFNQMAAVRSHATVLAYDIADRMRANRTVAKSGGYVIAIDAAASGTSIAQTDLADWKSSLDRYLPGGLGAVSVSGASGDMVTVTIQWDETRVGGQGNQKFVFETRL